MPRWRRHVPVLILAVVCLAGSVAQAAPSDRRAQQLAAALMSPFCPGLTLEACPSGAASDLRREIADRFAAGASREDIVADLVARYGTGIYSEPPASGLGLVLRIVPFGAAAALGVWLLTVPGRRRVARPRTTTPDDARGDGPLSSRLDDELMALD